MAKCFLGNRKVYAIVLVLAAVILVSLVGCAPAPTEVRELKLATATPGTSALDPMIIQMVESMGTYSEGAVKIKVYWAGEIAQVKDLPELCRTGSVDMIATPPVHYPSIFPLSAAVSMYPMLLPSPDQASYIWRGLLRDIPEVQEDYTKQNQYCLNRNTLSTYMTISKKPLRTVADFQGLKIRGMPGAYFSRVMEEAGATNNSAMPVPDIYEAFMRGVVDAVMLIPQDFEALKYYELAKYVSFPVGSIVGLTCNINLDVWNSLSSKTQKALTKAATEWGANEMEHQLTTFDQSIENLKAKGVQFIEFDQEDWGNMLAQAGDPWVAARDTLVIDLKVDAAVADKFVNRWHELYEEYEKEYVLPGKTWEYK